jgi:hypothetical protein
MVTADERKCTLKYAQKQVVENEKPSSPIYARSIAWATKANPYRRIKKPPNLNLWGCSRIAPWSTHGRAVQAGSQTSSPLLRS